MGHASVHLCNGIKGATGRSQFKVRHDVEMEQPLDGQWLIENGLKPWGEASRCAARWPCEQDVLSVCALEEDDHDGQCRNDEQKNKQEPFEAYHGLTRRRLVAQFGDTPIQLSDVSI
jgi:hypothetical protein